MDIKPLEETSFWSQVIDYNPLTAVSTLPLLEAMAKLVDGSGRQGEAGPPVWAGHGLFVVDDDRRLVGMLGLQRAMQLALTGTDLSDLVLADVMERPPIAVKVADVQDAASVLALMQQHQLQALPVVDGDRFVGAIAQREVLACLFPPRQQMAPLVSIHADGSSANGGGQALSLSQLCDLMPDVFFLKDMRTGEQLYVNRAYETLYGHSREAAYRCPDGWLEAIHPADRDRIRAKAAQQRQGKAFFDDEYRVVLPDGSLRWVWDCSFPVTTAAGEVRYFGGINRDITERKQLEAALKASQEQLQLLLDLNQVGWWTWQLDSGHLSWSDQAFQMLGYPPQAVEPSLAAWYARIHPEDRPWVEARVAHTQAKDAQGTVEIEYRVVHPDGQTRWLLSRCQQLQTAAGAALAGIVLDITERKHYQSLLESQAEIIDQVHDSVVATDLGGYVRFWNRGAERLFGYRAEEMIGCHISRVYPEDQQAFLQQQVIEPLLAQGHHEVEVQMQRPSGERFWGQLSLSLQRDSSGASIGMIGYTMDITERRQAALELQRLYEQAPCGYHSLDGEGRFVRINQTGLSMLGYGRAEVIGRSFADFLAPDSLQTFAINFPLFKQRGQVQNLELRMVRKDGSTLPVSLSAIAIKDADGHFLMSHSVVTDISERVRLQSAQQAAQLALRISESQRRQALNLTQIGWWDWDLVTHQHTWSDYTFRLLGYQPGEVTPSLAAWQRHQHPQDVLWQARVLDPDLNPAAGDIEYRVIHPDGSLHWLLVRARSVYDPTGQPLRMMGVIMDITEAQQAQLALQRSQAQMRLALEAGQLGTWQYSLETGEVAMDAGMCRIWDLPPAESPLSFEAFIQRIYPADRPTVTAALDAALAPQSDGLYSVDYRIQREDGSERWIVANGQALFEGEGSYRRAVRFFGTVNDITERKRAEMALQQQLKRERLVSELTRTIRQTLELAPLLQQAVTQVRQFLQTDRVLLLRFDADWQGQVVTESVVDPWASLRATRLYDPCFQTRLQQGDGPSRVSAIANVNTAPITPCHRQMLQQFQVQANLVVPIRQQHQLWGLLIAHHCSHPRPWPVEEVELLQQLADQLSIAIRQAELYDQTRRELQQRRQIQAALAASEARFRSLSTSAPIGIAQINPDGTCLYVNPRWEAMSGLTLVDSLGDGWMEAVHPEDRETLKHSWQAYLATGSHFYSEFRLQRPSGDIRWVVAKAAPILGDENTAIGHVSTIEDVTEQHQAEQKIRQQAALIDIATDAILVRDPHNRILFWNQGAERLYGWPQAEVLDRFTTEVFEPPEALREPLAQVHARDTWQGELTHTTRAGASVLVASRWTLMRDLQGHPQFILSVNTDISEKKRLEQQFYRAQRLESLGTLASGIAHDLNNVFTPILSISQLLPLQMHQPDASTTQMLSLLQDSTRRGVDMVRQVLTFARGQGGTPTAIQVNALLEEVVKLLRDTLPKNIRIDSAPATTRLPAVIADATQLQQVIMNLCVNARDAMPEGGILTLSTDYSEGEPTDWAPEAEAGPYVVIAIADTGMGIAPEICDRIFGPFFTTKPQGQGTGLGLSTALGIVQNVGGRLQVTSQPGQGSVFQIYLPASQEAESSAGSLPVVLLQGQGETILVVDDETIVQQTTQALLQQYGYHTLTASDGVEALDCYSEHQAAIAAVLMDMMMPTMDGPATLQALRQLNPDVKVLAASGISASQTTALAAGAQAFISKPYDAPTLLEALRLLLDF